MRRIEFTRRCAVTVAVAGCLVVGAGGGARGLEPVPEAAEVDRLYREASVAVKAHEVARKAVEAGRGEVERLRVAEEAERVRLDQLRAAMGELARSQYRGGGGGVGVAVRFLTAPSPELLMERISLARRGGHATDTLMTRVRESQARLARDRAASAAALGRLKGELARQSAAREEIEKKLKEAQERLRAAEEARRAALAAEAAAKAAKEGRGWVVSGGAPGPACGGAAEVVPLGPPPPAASSDRSVAPQWVKPVDPAPLSSGYAEAGGRWKHRHTGQDFAVFDGSAVRAVGEGTVEFVGCGDGFGNQVILRHGNGYFTQYAHLSVFGVRVGERVVTGQTIGLSGRTGNVSGPHLHFEVRVTPQLGSGVDPMPWLREHGVAI
ncbi:M23 family metallopeptidase [Streptomyces sp. NBC_00237]|uniref:M23 family metallopeptidase n=1 Tax=Streptomyces sp. NBC_00237 TaxID=2975687 RepID=UPI00225A98F9|nr:M23 family metallopeptidase [Streptomyces sp. NBC_00237]MCX5200209.1 M23 family metallopeptidase [Streptomyces sp. NBC_00237]